MWNGDDGYDGYFKRKGPHTPYYYHMPGYVRIENYS